VEWPEEGKGMIPVPDLDCFFDIVSEGRLLKVASHSQKGQKILEDLQDEK
jgi:hypothetical protein